MGHDMDRRQFVMLPVLGLALSAADTWRVRLSRFAPEHPEPRPGITAKKVLPPASYEAEVRKLEKSRKRIKSVTKRVAKSYEQAREIPEVLDGLYCYCDCSSYGHRSLLTCFEVVQAVGCWSCKEEAELAYALHKRGKTLDEIREAVDKKFD